MDLPSVLTPGTAWVAGGLGFIGSHLCESLLNNGWQVVCIDDLSSGSEGNLAYHRKLYIAHLDVTRPLPGYLPQPDLVYHLASPASPLEYLARPLDTIGANTAGTFNLLRAARGARFIYASTSEVYGDPTTDAQGEDDVLTTNPSCERAPYAVAKLMGETIVRQFENASSVRLFNVYGPRMADSDGRCIPEFIRAALSGEPLPIHGDGSQTRSFCYVDDAVKMLRLAATQNIPLLNIGNPEEVSVLDLAKTIIRLTSACSGLEFTGARQNDPKRRKPDISRFAELFGTQQFTSLETGLRRTLELTRR